MLDTGHIQSEIPSLVSFDLGIDRFLSRRTHERM